MIGNDLNNIILCGFLKYDTRNIRYFELTPDIADVGFIIGYILSPDDVFESCGLGMIGVLEPGPGGPPPGGPPPYTGDIPGCNGMEFFYIFASFTV